MDDQQIPHPQSPHHDDYIGGDQITTGDLTGTIAIGAGATATTTHHHHYLAPTSPNLATAQERLDSLPLDTVPDLAPLPPGSRMPLSRNPLFIGRTDDLMRLAATLKGG